MEQGAKFEGWAVVELFGHQKEAGYVTTQYFGDRAMFQIDVPEVPARQETLERPEWGNLGLMPEGTVIEKAPIAGRTRLVSPGAVYAMNPATEEAIRTVVARSERREIRVVSMPESAQLAAGDSLPGEDDEEEDAE